MCPLYVLRPAAPKPGGLQLVNLEAYPKNLKTWKIHHKGMILSLITYPLSPKMKPILTVYANVSKLPPLLTYLWVIEFEYKFHILVLHLKL